MNILILAIGYVGISTAAMLAELGWETVGFDPDEAKMESLSQGELPIDEPGLQEVLERHAQSGKMRFVQSLNEVDTDCDTIFLCVGTRSNPDGSANLAFIRQASEAIGERLKAPKLVVVKSTVPVGTDEKIERWIAIAQKDPVPFDVVVNP